MNCLNCGLWAPPCPVTGYDADGHCSRACGDAIEAAQMRVYVTCAECGHQVEDGEPCPFCEKNADTGSLDPHYGDDDAA